MFPDIDPVMLVFQSFLNAQAESPKGCTEKILSTDTPVLEAVLQFAYRVDTDNNTKLENYRQAIISQIENIVVPVDTCLRTTFPISMEGHE